MIPTNKTVEIYYLVDEFLKEYDAVIKSHSLKEGAAKKMRNRKFTMSGSEVMTILILFHFSSFRDLKHFYLFVRSRMKSDFPHTVSYNRFVELERKVCIPLAVFLKMKALGQCRRQSSPETYELPQTDLREALRRQGLYLERPLRTALH